VADAFTTRAGGTEDTTLGDADTTVSKIRPATGLGDEAWRGRILDADAGRGLVDRAIDFRTPTSHPWGSRIARSGVGPRVGPATVRADRRD